VKALQLLDEASAEVLALDWLVNAVAPVSPYGERCFAELRPFRPGEEPGAQSRAERIAGVAQRFDAGALDAIARALAQTPDAFGAIARASLGEHLSDSSFFELRAFCETIDRIDELCAGTPTLENLSNEAVREVREKLATGQQGRAEFYLADAFDAELAAARTRLARAQAELDALRGRERERVARELGREELGGDEFILMRAELRRALPEGIRVVREAPTYFLCTLDYGETALAALERRDAAAASVANAEESVRQALSALVQRNARGLLAAANALGERDVLVAAAGFAARFDCVPASVSDAPSLAFEQARFLPLECELASVGRQFTPLDLELDDAAVLTGPNMGGKSVCLLTSGFVALCVAFGLPVPAARARIGLFDQIGWLGMGREAQVGGLLSSFAQEVLILKEILARDADRLLILVDEFARTTTPHEGKALCVALLARLRERHACAILATHLEGLAAAAGVRHFAVRGLRGIPEPSPASDVREVLAILAASMDYRIAEVSGEDAARGDAIALAALLGIDRRFVESAYRALSQ
jgi:DNA mismatch repair ATPase MutS